jgi:hypothetical protein
LARPNDSAREAALDEAVGLYDQIVGNEDPGLRDMAVLGVIADAMQPLEDLAHLGTAWDAPFTGLATYVRATTYSDRIPTNFWQEVARWDDARLDVLAGFAMRDPNTKLIRGVLDVVGFTAELPDDSIAVLDKACVASRTRLHAWLDSLASDWTQFAPYFRAFKHGGLAPNRADTTFVDDDVTTITDETTRLEPSIAVWKRRGGGDEVYADCNLKASDVVECVSGSGRLAIKAIQGFLASRLALLDSIEIDTDGNVAGFKPELQFPWTIWLSEGDLTTEEWSRLGSGPRLNLIAPEPER